MATKTFYLVDAAASGSNHLSLQDGGSPPSNAMIATGWKVGTIGTNRYNLMDSGTEVTVATGDTTVMPDAAPNNTLGDCFRSENTIYGTFANANWSLSLQVIGETRATGTQDGRLRIRIWKSANQDGSSATELTTSTLATTTYTNLANSAYQTLTVTFTPEAALQLTNEYLFVQVSHQITGSGDNADCDCHLAVGSSNFVTTSDFATGGHLQVSHGGVYFETSRKAVQVSHGGVYFETLRKAIQVSHVGVYFEIGGLAEASATLNASATISTLGSIQVNETLDLDRSLSIGLSAIPPVTLTSEIPGHHVIFYDTTGTRQALVVDFLSLSYVKRVNAPGLLQIAFSGDHYILGLLQDKWEVEVWRKPPGSRWYRDFVGIFRDENWSYSTDGSLFVMQAPGIMSRLNWRVVNWYAGYADRSKFTAVEAETIAKTLVEYNAGASATVANGRQRDGVIDGISVETDNAGGNVIDWPCHGATLLDTLQDIAKVGGGDFDLYKRGANDWEFRWHEGQLGEDRSATVKFSMELGNMAEPQYQLARSNEATVAAVWGQGESDDRDYVTRTGVNYDDDENDIEIYVDARNVGKGETDGLNVSGDKALAEAQARSKFTFKAVEIPAVRYGVDYYLGDIVTAINPYTGESLLQKVGVITVTLEENGMETITPEFTEP